jgi:apolipoprotein N-acyltransferase
LSAAASIHAPSPARRNPLLQRWLRPLLALAAGALAPLSFSPVGLWPCGLLSVILCYCLLQDRSPRAAAQLGWCYGLGWFGVGTSWIYVSISVYGNAAPPLAFIITALFVAIMALYFALFAWVWRRWASRRLPLLGFAAVWVLAEWLRGWLFTGFPWLQLGSAHVTTALSGLAPIFGVLGISLVLALLGAIAGELLLRLWRERRLLPLARSPLPTLYLLLFLGAWFSDRLIWVVPGNTAPVSVGLVQGNIPQGLKFDNAYLQDIIDTYDILSAPLWQHDLVLWPETALPVVQQDAAHILDYFAAQAGDYDSTLVTGIFSRDAGGSMHNSVTVLGEGSGTWHKQKLVPFGEYVPLQSVLNTVLQLFALPMSAMSPGPADQNLLNVAGHQVAAFICYEVVYPDFVRRYGADADFLLTISNDTWFGASWGPPQHLQIAALRARELGRYMVRATNDGISAIIDERGRIVQRSGQFTKDILQGEIRLFEGQTPFARWGSLPVLLLAALLLLQNLLPWQSQRAGNKESLT